MIGRVPGDRDCDLVAGPLIKVVLAIYQRTAESHATGFAWRELDWCFDSIIGREL